MSGEDVNDPMRSLKIQPQPIDDYKVSHDTKEDNVVYKGLSQHIRGVPLTMTGNHVKNPTRIKQLEGSPKHKENQFPGLNKEEVSILAFQLQVHKGGIPSLWEELVPELQATEQTDFTFGQLKCIGNQYHEGKHAEFYVALFEALQLKDTNYLEIRRLCGDTFVMDHFHQVLKTKLNRFLKESEQIVAAVDPENDGREEFEEDDTSDYGFPEMMPECEYLHLEKDPALVRLWLNKLEDEVCYVQDVTHVLGLMEHSATTESNLKVLWDNGEQKLVSVIQRYVQGRENAAQVRHAASLFNKLLEYEDFQKGAEITEELIKDVAETMAHWGPRSTNRTFEVCQSRQSFTLLLKCLLKLCDTQAFPQNFQPTVKKYLTKVKINNSQGLEPFCVDKEALEKLDTVIMNPQL